VPDRCRCAWRGSCIALSLLRPLNMPVPPSCLGAVQMCMAGFLPFSAIYIELYYIFASVWGHKIYTIYSILFIVFLILIVVTAFITIALTYFQLAIEDHEWWWRSDLRPAAVLLSCLFLFLHALFCTCFVFRLLITVVYCSMLSVAPPEPRTAPEVVHRLVGLFCAGLCCVEAPQHCSSTGTAPITTMQGPT